MILSLPPDPGASTLAALSAASLVCSFMTAAFGLGGGVAMPAILAALLPPAALIPVHGLVQLASSAGGRRPWRATCTWRRCSRS